MHRSKIGIFVIVMILCCTAILAGHAANESTLAELWNSGCEFLFHTNNVTVSGEASFFLDGERFKTAKLHYIQDDFKSFYGLTLLTPRAEGDDRETGWTIIADEEGYRYVMEAYEPGVYRIGSGRKENTLLRRTVRLDALTELGTLVIAQAEPLLPEGTVNTADENGLRTVHITVSQEQMPQIALSALNLAADYLSDRWFAFGFDRSLRADDSAVFDNYITVTQALTDGTVQWTLRNADITFTLDSQNRLTAAKGTVQAASTFWDQSTREVKVSFDLVMGEYGESQVKPFDPADYNVVLADEEGTSVKTITAMAAEPAMEHFASYSSYARISGYDPDTNKVEIELIGPEIFRREDVESLKTGDIICTGGQEIIVSSITEEYGYIILNEGDFEFSDGSVWLMEDSAGNFRPVIYEDYVWTEMARVELPVTDKLLFLDMIEPESGELLEKPKVNNATEFLRCMTNDNDPGFDINNIMVVFDQDGDLAMVERFYVPWQ
ncbi:MAG: hypothetical protein IKH57_09970 [Clostridia bacterium]|nr:hypothetical protein [Clostridia bacterium]